MRQAFPYQQAAVQAVRDHWAAGRRSVVLVAPVGAGKTFTAELLVRKWYETKWGQVLWIAHNDVLVDQPSIGFSDAGIPHAFVKAGRSADADAQVQVCTWQTLVRREFAVARGPDGRPFRRALVVVDECFPAGTLVDGRPIETLRPGDVVASADSFGRVQQKRVIRVFQRRARRLVRVHLASGGSIDCTPEHPFFTQGKYVAACNLCAGDVLWGHAASRRSDLLGMSSAIQEPSNREDLFARLPPREARQDPALDCTSFLLRVRETDGDSGAAAEQLPDHGPRVLFEKMCRHLQGQCCRTFVSRVQPESRGVEDAGRKPHAQHSRADENDSDSERDWAPPLAARRERSTAANSTCHASQCACGVRGRLASGVRCSDRRAEEGWDAFALQDRHCVAQSKACRRDRRLFAQRACSAGPRRAEGFLLAVDRVASVEVLESRSSGEHSDDRGISVYNVEVEGNHNYFVDGILVHNCHRIKSASYMQLREMLLQTYDFVYFLLLTATPYRLDGQGLADVADALVEAATPRQLVEMGRILEPLYWSQPPPAGDADEVARRPAVVGDALAMWLKHARGLPTLARCRSIAHSQATAARFRDAGIRAVHVDGSMSLAERRRYVCGLAVGGVASSHPLAVDVLFTGSPLFDEGFDSRASWEMLLQGLPELRDFWLGSDPPAYQPLRVLLDMNQTNSRGLWMQLQGRVVRAWPGSEEAIVLCLSGNLEAHGFLCQHHGFSLDRDARWATRARAGDGVPRMSAQAPRRCPGCLSVEPPGSERCRACGTELGPPPRLPEEDRSVELVRVAAASDAPPADPSVAEAFLRKKYKDQITRSVIRVAAGGKPYKPGWAAEQYRAKFRRYPPRGMDEMIRRELGIKS